MESNMEVPIKVKIDLPYNPQFHFCEYTQKEMITIIRPCIHTYAYGSTPEDVHEVTSNLAEV